MDIFNLNYDEFELFLFVFVRVGTIILFAPVLGSQTLPRTLKIGLIFMISVVVFPLVSSNSLAHPKGILDLAVRLISEGAIGLIISYAARLVFISVQIAGTLVDFQMGFGVVNVLDPQTNTQVSITAQFENILAVLIFLAVDAHHFFIHTIVDSFAILNPDHFNFSSSTMDFLLTLFSGAFMTAIKLAAPAMAVLFFISVSLGLIARTVPQMNVFIVAFPLQIGMGLLMIGMTITFFVMIVKRQFLDLPYNFMGLLGTM
ncbi:MAG: flagellar biosynthetic protein FliR [Nitrospinota bacterium]|nr:flagellar biosynthetic protein FliR [Nitrospinota bacterium]